MVNGVEVFTNDGLGTVTAGGTDAPAPGTVEALTVTVTNAFPFASSSANPPVSFYVCDPAAETEKMLVTVAPGGVSSGQAWTVTRGASGTTPVAHVAGYTIVQAATALTFGALQPGYQNIASAYWGADPSGVADSTAAINAALAAGGQVYGGTGTYAVSSPLNVSVAGTSLIGANWGSMTIKPTAGFSGAAIINVTAAHCEIAKHQILGGQSATYSSNPATVGIEVGGAAQYCSIHDISAYYVNGWEIEAQASQTSFPLGLFLHTIQGFQHKQGIHLKGTGAQSFNMQAQITDVQHGQIYGDSLFIEDALDVSVKGHNDSVVGSSGGSALHIKGKCGAINIVNCDLGVFPTPGTAPVILIEDATRTITGTVSVSGTTTITDSGGSFTNADIGRTVTTANVTAGTTIASVTNATTAILSVAATGTSGPQNATLFSTPYTDIAIGPGICQQGLNGVQVNGGGGFLTFHEMTFKSHQDNGAVIASTGVLSQTGTQMGGTTGDQIHFTDCYFGENGIAGTGPFYDIDWTGASTGTVRGCRFVTPIGTGVGQVSHPATFTGGQVTVADCSMMGNGTTLANTFGTAPAYTRGNLPYNPPPAAPAAFHPANPASTTSSPTLVMMGLGTTCVYTPTGKGNVLVNVTGAATNLTAGVNVNIGPRYGNPSGSAPANGAALTGTRFGGSADPVVGSSLSPTSRPFAFTDVLALTPGTSYWFDLAISTSAAADAAEVVNISMSFVEPA